MPRRSKPMMIAPLIPALGLLGIVGLDRLHGSHYMPFFVIVWCIMLATLLAYVLTRTLEARKKRI